MMKIHELKTVEPYFSLIKNGAKNFEVRNNDRDFKRGDILHLRKYEPNDRNNPEYPGQELLVRVNSVFLELPGVLPNYCILSISDPL